MGYFRVPILNSLGKLFNNTFRPVLLLKENISKSMSLRKAFVTSKENLIIENENLSNQVLELNSKIAQFETISKENEKMQEVLSRSVSRDLVLAQILLRPSKYFYDYLIIDIGKESGIEKGNLVFALGNVPVGKVSEVFERSSRVTLFSTSGEVNEAYIKDTAFDLVGRGGGNFEVILPKDFELEIGEKATLTGLNTNIVGIVGAVISDPRDTFTKAILKSPVNFNKLQFVQVQK